MTHKHQLIKIDEINPAAVQPIIREGIIILGMLGFTVLGLLLPGTARELPGTDVAFGDLVIGIGTLGIVASLLYAAPTLNDLVEGSLAGNSAVVADAASIVQYLVVFVAILIAHQGFAPVIFPLIDVIWAYDLAFLLIALIPLGVVAHRFHHPLDPLT